MDHFGQVYRSLLSCSAALYMYWCEQMVALPGMSENFLSWAHFLGTILDGVFAAQGAEVQTTQVVLDSWHPTGGQQVCIRTFEHSPASFCV